MSNVERRMPNVECSGGSEGIELTRFPNRSPEPRNSELAVRHSPFVIRNSSFVIRNSPFRILNSLFGQYDGPNDGHQQQYRVNLEGEQIGGVKHLGNHLSILRLGEQPLGRLLDGKKRA